MTPYGSGSEYPCSSLIVNETLDSILDESGDEEEQEAVVNQVLDEIDIEMSGRVSTLLSLISAGFLRAIYMVRLCRMRQAYDRPTTRIVSCKSNLQLAYDCRVRHKKCRRI